MKKPSTLAEQIQKAKQVYESWPDSRKSNLRLEGTDLFLSRFSSTQLPQQKILEKEKK